MAKKVTVDLVDDMNPEQSADETVTFALDGVAFEIDLSARNAAGLRTKMQPYVAAGRRIGRAPQKSGGVRVAARDDLDAIRAWAKGKGKKVAQRGRIAHDIINEYDAEKAQPVKVSTTAKKAAPDAVKAPETTDVKQPAFSG